jgi:mgtE-like transporter
MLHTGEVKPQFTKNTPSFYSLLSSIFVLTFADTVGMGLIAFVTNLIFQNVSLESLMFFIVLPVLTCSLSVLIAIPVTLFVAIKAYMSGLDPDILVYPIMSTTNDIIVSLIYITLVSLLLKGGAYMIILEMVIIIIALSSAFLFIKHFRKEVFKTTLNEGIPIVLLSSLFGSVNGIALASFRGDFEKNPSILMLYPGMMNILGNIGSIIGSMESTKLALGYIKSFKQVLKDAIGDLLSVETAAFLMHVILGIAVYIVGSITNVQVNFIFLLQAVLLSNVMSFLMISLFSLIIATQTFKHGLDPDNFVIPLTTSVSDTVSTFILMIVLVILTIH